MATKAIPAIGYIKHKPAKIKAVKPAQVMIAIISSIGGG